MKVVRLRIHTAGLEVGRRSDIGRYIVTNSTYVPRTHKDAIMHFLIWLSLVISSDLKIDGNDGIQA